MDTGEKGNFGGALSYDRSAQANELSALRLPGLRRGQRYEMVFHPADQEAISYSATAREVKTILEHFNREGCLPGTTIPGTSIRAVEVFVFTPSSYSWRNPFLQNRDLLRKMEIQSRLWILTVAGRLL